VTAVVVVLADHALTKPPSRSISVDRIIDQMVVESDDERVALQLILSGDEERVDRGRRLLEEAALLGRPTAQRHLATYWALTDDADKRARVYQWLVIALACARGVDLELAADTQINYLLFLTNIALIEHATPQQQRDLGREWAKGWFDANVLAPGLASCDVTTIDDYSED
jgi:hypothetical protein